MAQDKYLDDVHFISALSAAERTHHLDYKGVMEKLQEAQKYCGQMARQAYTTSDEYRDIAEQYTLAQGRYFAEIRRRADSQGSTLHAWFDSVGGAAGVGVSRSQVYLLSNIAENVNPLAALRSQREKDKAKSRQKVVRDHLEVIATTRDPLRPVKREWSKLSPRQQDEFFRWAKTQLRATGRDPK